MVGWWGGIQLGRHKTRGCGGGEKGNRERGQKRRKGRDVFQKKGRKLQDRKGKEPHLTEIKRQSGDGVRGDNQAAPGCKLGTLGGDDTAESQIDTGTASVRQRHDDCWFSSFSHL